MNDPAHKAPLIDSDALPSRPVPIDALTTTSFEYAPDTEAPVLETNGRPWNNFWTLSALAFFAVLLPGLSLIQVGDVGETLRLLGQNPIVFYVATIFLQIFILGMVIVGVAAERANLASLGVNRFRPLYAVQGVVFLMATAVVLLALEAMLSALGFPIRDEVRLLLPDTGAERVWWFFVSLSAAVCEELAFRGFLLTRLKTILGHLNPKLSGWTPAVIVSAIAFGVGHNYQGVAGLVLVTILGAGLSLLYIRTGSLWPCIVAHFLQDFLHIFVPIFDKQ